uniref:Uncharacterized protein n=1 Tax=Anguilla anguilla TaxID=7936 RepID=A0A0E9QX23_ANGAN
MSLGECCKETAVAHEARFPPLRLSGG